MHFFQDEFAGRIATKVMQTALAVRDTWLIVCELIVFIVIYFVTLLAVLGGFDLRLLVPFLGLARAVPLRTALLRAEARPGGEGAGRCTLADDRDASPTPTPTSRPSSSSRTPSARPAYARGAMQEFLATVHAQMRLVTGFEIVNHILSMGLIAASAGATLWLWTQGEVGVGAVAATTAMALRLNGISHWVMWEMAALFEHIGTVQDGINTLSRPHAVVDAADAKPLVVTPRRDPLRERELRLRRQVQRDRRPHA